MDPVRSHDEEMLANLAEFGRWSLDSARRAELAPILSRVSEQVSMLRDAQVCPRIPDLAGTARRSRRVPAPPLGPLGRKARDWSPSNGLATGIADTAPTIRQTVERALTRIDETDGAISAFVRLDRAGALAHADALDAEAERGEPRPLRGLTFAVKDAFDTAGVETKGGSEAFAGRVPDRDAHAVKVLREAGAVLLGKLHMDELGIGLSDVPTRNPFDLERTPGGSSAGAGAAVAAGYCSFTLGADTGGSVRIPASFTGVCGFKPTFGLVGRSGVLPLSCTLDHVGILAWHPAEILAILDVLATVDSGDSATEAANDVDWRSVPATARRPVVGVLEPTQLDGVQDDIVARYRNAIRTLQSEGLELREVALPDSLEVAAAHSVIVATEAAVYYRDALGGREHLLGDDTRRRLEIGRCYLAEHYLRAQRVRDAYRADVERLWDDVDYLVTPTCPISPPLRGRDHAKRTRGQLLRFTGNLNMAGVPALSLPAGKDDLDLPVGLQLIGPRFNDAAVLQTGAWLFNRLRPEEGHAV